jgi:hypothetical protein
MYIQDRTNLSPRARIVSNDIKVKDDFEDPQSSMPRLRSASTALEAITSRIANLSGDAKAAARRRQQTTSDAMLFKVKQDILMINPFLFRTFKERLVASNVYAPILVHGALLEFFNDLKIPDIQHELKQEALARSSLPIDNDLRDHFTSSFSSLETASKRLRNNSVTATKATTTTAAITTDISNLSIIKEDMRLSPASQQNISSPLGTVTKTIIEDPLDEIYDGSDEEGSVSDSSSDEEDSVSDSSSDEESIVSASTNASVSSYASFMSESGESQESERLEV